MTQSVVIARLMGVFGIRGEIKCRPAASGDDALKAGRTYRIGSGAAALSLRCRSTRRHHDKLLIAFHGIDTPEAARPLVNCDVYGDLTDVELGPGEYLDADLVGLRLIDVASGDLGRVVSGVVHYPAQDCLVVEPGHALVPLIKAFIVRIDIANRTIVTTLPDGLFD